MLATSGPRTKGKGKNGNFDTPSNDCCFAVNTFFSSAATTTTCCSPATGYSTESHFNMHVQHV
jgi:hypothetical protein